MPQTCHCFWLCSVFCFTAPIHGLSLLGSSRSALSYLLLYCQFEYVWLIYFLDVFFFFLSLRLCDAGCSAGSLASPRCFLVRTTACAWHGGITVPPGHQHRTVEQAIMGCIGGNLLCICAEECPCTAGVVPGSLLVFGLHKQVMGRGYNSGVEDALCKQKTTDSDLALSS